jgi:hypothetical protein
MIFEMISQCLLAVSHNINIWVKVCLCVLQHYQMDERDCDFTTVNKIV